MTAWPYGAVAGVADISIREPDGSDEQPINDNRRATLDPREDISRKLNVQPDLLLMGVLDKKIVATVMAGYEGHRGWINYLAVRPTNNDAALDGR